MKLRLAADTGCLINDYLVILFNATIDAELFGNKSTKIVLVTLNSKAAANATTSTQYQHPNINYYYQTIGHLHAKLMTMGIAICTL